MLFDFGFRLKFCFCLGDLLRSRSSLAPSDQSDASVVRVLGGQDAVSPRRLWSRSRLAHLNRGTQRSRKGFFFSFCFLLFKSILSICSQSTLLKLILGELTPSDGTVQRHSHLVIGHFHQHLSELLDPNMNPLDYMLKHYPMER